MFKGLLKGLTSSSQPEVTVMEKEEEVKPKERPQPTTPPDPEKSPFEDKVIDSAFIQKDIAATFDSVLAEFELNASKETQVEQLEQKLEGFKTQNQSVYDKIEKLKAFGFTNTPSATATLKKLEEKEANINAEKAKIQSEIDSANLLQKRIAEYKLKYPTFKFVDNDTMVSIMKKYDLWLGETSLYCKEIPDRALNIIDGFRDEIEKSTEKVEFYMDTYRGMTMHVGVNITPVVKEEKKAKDYTEAWYLQQEAVLMSESRRSIFRTDYRTKLKMIAPASHFEVVTQKIYDERRREYKECPMYLMNPATRRFEPTTKMMEEIAKSNREVLDPIACLEVDGGFIILDAWDKEAEIPEIKNQILN